VKALRCQLPRRNRIYREFLPDDGEDGDKRDEGSDDEKEDDEDAPHAPVWPGAHLCAVCGLRGASRCATCHAVHYCCREHQRVDWRRHKPSCVAVGGAAAAAPTSDGVVRPSLPAPRSSLRNWLFPAFELEVSG
jgi:hypothetical protein